MESTAVRALRDQVRAAGILLAAALTSAALAAAPLGCGAPERPEEAGPSATARIRERVWAAHGGAARWRDAGAVRFSYAVAPRGASGRRFLGHVAFRIADYRHLWVSTESHPEPLRLDLESPPGAIARQLRRRGVEVPAAEVAVVDFALRSIRYLFQLPLASSVGRWQFRGLVGPPGIPVPALLEVVPQEAGAPLGPCLLHLAHPDAPVASAVYAPLRGVLGGDLVRVRFDRYEAVDGVLVALERRHAPVGDEGDGEPARDPFGIVTPSDLRADPCVLREWIQGVAFVGVEEADRLCPLPEDGVDAGALQQGVDGTLPLALGGALQGRLDGASDP